MMITVEIMRVVMETVRTRMRLSRTEITKETEKEQTDC